MRDFCKYSLFHKPCRFYFDELNSGKTSLMTAQSHKGKWKYP